MYDSLLIGVLAGLVCATAYGRARRALVKPYDLEFWLWIIFVLWAIGSVWLNDLVAH